MKTIAKERFREALISRIKDANLTSLTVEKGSGVSKTTIDKLRQRAVTSTNVHDAIKIAKFFGMTVEQFMDMETSSQSDILMGLVSMLTPEERGFLQAMLEGLIAGRTAMR